MSCRIELGRKWNHGAELNVSGADTTRVAGIFRELERELQARSIPGSWIVGSFENLWFSVALGVLIGLGIYSAFNFLIHLGEVFIAGFQNSSVKTAWAAGRVSRWSSVMRT